MDGDLLVELRLLTGPNLYFLKPAVKLTLDARAVLGADAAAVVGWQEQLRVRGSIGLSGSEVRHVAAAALAAGLVRRAGTALGLKVAAIGRTGDDDTVVVAFPFRRRGTAQAFAHAVAEAFAAITLEHADPSQVMAGIPAALAGHDLGERVTPLRARVPVVAVTGTNGKTTTTRLIAHLIKAGGRIPGWSSTDGIVIDGETVETGDWSGPGGAARVLEDPSVQVAVTETARGGILLRGMGTAANDVSVVTNISADHLGLLGVHTVEQLAQVKAVVPRATKPTGWAVLNADDELVLAMRSGVRARTWLFSPDPDNPDLADAVAAGGRAITVIDGDIAVLDMGFDPTRVLPVAQVPLTLGGASKVNVANVLAATAAALAVGVPLEAVRRGLRSFSASAEQNAGRLNTYRAGEVVVVLDLAHNEASLASLLEVAEALRTGPGELGIVLGTAGDRTDEAIYAMGVMAGAVGDRVVIAARQKYLRGRAPGEMEALWRAGAAEGGVLDAVEVDGELDGLRRLLDADLPDGSVIAVCALEEREEMVAEIERRGGAELTPAEITARVG